MGYARVCPVSFVGIFVLMFYVALLQGEYFVFWFDNKFHCHLRHFTFVNGAGMMNKITLIEDNQTWQSENVWRRRLRVEKMKTTSMHAWKTNAYVASGARESYAGVSKTGSMQSIFPFHSFWRSGCRGEYGLPTALSSVNGARRRVPMCKEILHTRT